MGGGVDGVSWRLVDLRCPRTGSSGGGGRAKVGGGGAGGVNREGRTVSSLFGGGERVVGTGDRKAETTVPTWLPLSLLPLPPDVKLLILRPDEDEIRRVL